MEEVFVNIVGLFFVFCIIVAVFSFIVTAIDIIKSMKGDSDEEKATVPPADSQKDESRHDK